MTSKPATSLHHARDVQIFDDDDLIVSDMLRDLVTRPTPMSFYPDLVVHAFLATSPRRSPVSGAS
jgi:hypothetical protein